MRSLGALLMFTGCQSVGIVTLDASHDTMAPDPDGPQHNRGVFVAWKAQPSLPGMLTDRIAVSAATFQVSHLQVVGDAGPGDERTTRSRYLVQWSSQGTPALESFPDAPAGVYSKITVDTTAGNLAPYAYEIEGTWRQRRAGPGPGDAADDQLRPFRIIDLFALSATLDCDEALAAGGSATLTINVALAEAVGNIDFDRLGSDGDSLVLAPNDPQMPPFRERLRRAFHSD
jgi:hypothetical protein